MASLTKLAWVLQVLLLTADAGASSSSSCCAALQSALGDKTVLPDSAAYARSLDSYWTAIASSIQPACIVSAATSHDVSKAVGLLTAFQCQFAIRSGGHDPSGSSNIEGGVTLDLSALNEVAVSADSKITRIGPGNRWQDVYLKLDALGLAVPGGRVANVGVGGLLTGGGLSFFSPRAGLACDSVLNFEVVLFDGSIVNANATSNPDLWMGLKGGSSNLGVVTSFSMKTFEQGKSLGGGIAHTIDKLPEVVRATVGFAASDNYDPYATLLQSYAYIPQGPDMKGWLIYNTYQYTKDDPKPAVFEPFMAIQPQMVNTLRISNLTDFTLELDASNPRGYRTTFMTTSVAVDENLLLEVFHLANETVVSLEDVPGLVWYLTYQPLPKATTRWSKENGGNVLGLDEEDNLILILVMVTWGLSADDERVNSGTEGFFKKVNDHAMSLGLSKRFRYLNYSHKTQDPIQGYGEESVAFLKRVSRQYDPKQTFQKLVSSGHKLKKRSKQEAESRDEL